VKDFVIYFSGYGATKDQTVLSLEALRQERHYNYDIRFVTGDALIGRSRSRAATAFLSVDDAPFMIFIDTDIVFRPTDIDMLVTAMRMNLDVVGGAYAVANGEHLAISGTTPVAFDGRVSEIEYVSTGFMAISRKILEKLKEGLPLLHRGQWCECYPFFESRSEGDKYLSEDWDFCQKVREKGGHIFVHTGCLVGHIKEHVLDPHEALDRMLKKDNDECEGVQSTIVKDLSDFLGMTEVETYTAVATSYVDAIEEASVNEDYYHTGQKLIFDLASFNKDKGYSNRLAPIADAHDQKVLDFGCGIGTATLWLAGKRNTILAYDLNQRCLEFARFRNERFGFSKVTFTDTLPDELDVDLVIAIDVFEHIKDIKGVLLDLGRKLKKDTRLYFFCPWLHKHPLHITNKDQLKEALEAAGFLIWNDCWAIKG